MSLLNEPQVIAAPWARYLTGLAVWVLGWLALVWLDGPLDLSALGMVLVLTSAVAAVWLPVPATLVLGLLAVMGFNWMFVPPRGTFTIDLHEHTVLLLVMFALNMIVAGLMSNLREQVRQAQQQALVADNLRAWGERLRDADDARSCVPELRERLQTLTGAPVALLLLRAGLPRTDASSATELLGEADDEQRAGLWYCLHNRCALGPDSGNYQELGDYYFPLRGRALAHGAALVVRVGWAFPADKRAQAQDLCDQMGAALERQQMLIQQQEIQQAAQEQELRATLLAAIAHDYRTPLATIMGAASSLTHQDAKLSQEQRQQLSRRIVDEATRLRQMTNNILQLARLDTPGLQLRCDWEAAEELVGSLVQRYRTQLQGQRLQVRVESGLPLLWCDPLLISQLLDNLVDNAFKYSVPGTAVHVGAHRSGEHVVLSVRDEGPGIPESAQAVIFQAYRQGQILPAMAANAGPVGVGIGLALCRVIAIAHGGELRLESAPGGSCFECALPLRPQPAQPAGENAADAGGDA